MFLKNGLQVADLITSGVLPRFPRLSFVSVESDPSSPNYGTMTVLQLPSNAQVNGPGQVANDFESFAPASKELSLFRWHARTRLP